MILERGERFKEKPRRSKIARLVVNFTCGSQFSENGDLLRQKADRNLLHAELGGNWVNRLAVTGELV